MKNNFYDSWSVIFDNDGRPLVGRITFLEANTSNELRNIYDVDGNILANPIYCNCRPKAQVCLDDGEYTVRYEKYIGHGNMESDNNEDSWLNYKTELVKTNEVKASTETKTFTVDTIGALKNIATMEDNDVALVLGYDSVNDCPARYFVWRENSIETDDGGCFIKSNTTTSGAWHMKIPSSYIDVRWYGDFPSNSSTRFTSNLGQRTKAANAANRFRKDLYFPSYTNGDNVGFYAFDGSNTVSINKDIICDNGVRFVVKTGTVGTSIICHQIVKCDKYLFVSETSSVPIGSYSLICDWINTSWLNKADTILDKARVGYVIDYLNALVAFKDKKIKFERDGLNVAGCIFDNCEFIDCYKNIDKLVAFKNMTIDTKWFADDFDYVNNLVLSPNDNNVVLLDKCLNADNYILLKNKIQDYNYGSLGEQHITNAIIMPNCTLENCYGSAVFAGASGSFELHNCTLVITGLANGMIINAVDCWLTFNDNLPTISCFYLRRGSMYSATGLMMTDECYITEATINCPLFLNEAHTVEVKDNDIVTGVNIVGQSNCRINGNTFEEGSSLAYTWTGESDMVGSFIGNKILAGSLGFGYAATGGPTGAKTIRVNCVWKDNYSALDGSFININLAHIYNNDGVHKYVYESNSGPNVLQRYPTGSWAWVGADVQLAGAETESQNGWCVWRTDHVVPTVQVPIFMGVHVRDLSHLHLPIFAIGDISTVKLHVSFTFRIRNTGTANEAEPPYINLVEFSGLVDAIGQNLSTYTLSGLNDKLIGNMCIVGKNYFITNPTLTVSRVQY